MYVPIPKLSARAKFKPKSDKLSIYVRGVEGLERGNHASGISLEGRSSASTPTRMPMDLPTAERHFAL